MSKIQGASPTPPSYPKKAWEEDSTKKTTPAPLDEFKVKPKKTATVSPHREKLIHPDRKIISIAQDKLIGVFQCYLRNYKRDAKFFTEDGFCRALTEMYLIHKGQKTEKTFFDNLKNISKIKKETIRNHALGDEVHTTLKKTLDELIWRQHKEHIDPSAFKTRYSPLSGSHFSREFHVDLTVKNTKDLADVLQQTILPHKLVSLSFSDHFMGITASTNEKMETVYSFYDPNHPKGEQTNLTAAEAAAALYAAATRLKIQLPICLDITSARLNSEDEKFSDIAYPDKHALLKKYYDVDSRGITPLQMACQMGNKDSVEFFLQLSSSALPDIHREDDEKFTPLHLACQNGHADIVKLLLNAPVFPKPDINKQNENGDTALHLAVQSGSIECVKALLTHRFSPALNINKAEKNGFTALHLACQWGHTEIVKVLLDANTRPALDCNIPNKEKTTALHLACQNGHTKCVEQLLKNPMLERNVANDRGNTPLHLACLRGHLESVKLLTRSLTFKEINTINHKGDTPLRLASRKGWDDIVQELSLVKAELEDKNDKVTKLEPSLDKKHHPMKQSPLEEYKPSQPSELYLELGYALHKSTITKRIKKDSKNKSTPFPEEALKILCANNQSDGVKLLFKKFKKETLSASDWLTALKIAAARKHKNVLKILLKNRVSLSETQQATLESILTRIKKSSGSNWFK